LLPFFAVWQVDILIYPSAEFFSRWGREDQPQNQWVVALYTRDFGAFMAMDKVWIPERGTFLQINNMNQTEAATARAQERLDSRIQDEFGVRSPFILFCRHRRMSGMTFLGDGERFNEMVLYPNVQDAMFFGVAVPLAEAVAKRHGHEWGRKQWHSRLTAWGIRHIDETRNEFKYHMEGVM
jgi:magnesium-dependent phosphatase 1